MGLDLVPAESHSKDTASSISLKLGKIFSHWTLLRKMQRASPLQDTPAHSRGIPSMSWLRGWRRSNGPGDEERRTLEAWVRLRFQLVSSDPMTAIIGAFGRLIAAGMDEEDATETVLRILRENESDGRP